MNEEEVKAENLKNSLRNTLQDALKDSGEEVLLNRWVFVADMLIDGNRIILPIWDDGMDAIDIESILAPAYRTAKMVTDEATIGLTAGAVGYLHISQDDDEDEDE